VSSNDLASESSKDAAHTSGLDLLVPVLRNDMTESISSVVGRVRATRQTVDGMAVEGACPRRSRPIDSTHRPTAARRLTSARCRVISSQQPCQSNGPFGCKLGQDEVKQRRETWT
jgi:hypothetical protein